MKLLEDENTKLRKLVADPSLDKEMLQDILRQKLYGLLAHVNLSTAFVWTGMFRDAGLALSFWLKLDLHRLCSYHMPMLCGSDFESHG